MRTIEGVRASWLVGALGACIIVAGTAHAQIATERPGSILIFPKVVQNGTRDTTIHIANTGNMVNRVECFYIDGRPDRRGQVSCAESDFELVLTRQQPTHWRASTGRRVNPFDAFGSEGAGLDPGLVPALPTGFEGALICVEVNQNGEPVAQNKLKGEANIHGLGSNLSSSSKYNALAIPDGTGANDMLNTLQLDGSEYAACPASHVLNFIADGGNDPVIEELGNGGLCSVGGDPCNSTGDCTAGVCNTGNSAVVTNLTILPCNLDMRTAFAQNVTLFFERWDEFEGFLSGGFSLSCWASFSLSEVPALRSTTMGSPYGTVRIRSTAGGPFVAIAESFHSDSVGATGSAAVDLILEGADPSARIILPTN